MAAPTFLPKLLVVYFQGAKLGKICELNKFIMVHKRKKMVRIPTFFTFL